MTLDRKDYKSAIPQLEKRLSAVENDTTKGLQGFDVLKAALEAEKLARQKAVLKVDEGIDLVTVKMFYALVDPDDYVGGLPPASTEWSETMPDITSADEGLVLWYKSKTLRNGVVVNETPPQQIQLMNGVFSFVNTVAGDNGWTTIDGGSITTGVIQASQGDSFFNLNDGTFKVYSSATGQGLVWNGSNLTINGSITLTGHSDSLATEISNLQSGVTSASRTATSYITYINATDGIKVHDSANSSSYTKLNSNGMQVYKGGNEVANFGDTARIGRNASGQSRTEIGTSGMQIIQNVNGTDTQIANLGYGYGKGGSGTDEKAPYYTFGIRKSGSVIGNYSVAEGLNVTAGYTAHAEGQNTTASGSGSHAEGGDTVASGLCSHAEGTATVASNDNCHASGYKTTAQYSSQFVIGTRNNNTYGNVFEIGNGDEYSDTYSNAFTVDWDGNVTASGNIRATTETPTISITTSSGTLNDKVIRRFGNVVQLLLSVRTSASTASGGDIYIGTISTTGLRPLMATSGGTYYGSYAINGTISSTGVITVRNSDSRALSATGTNNINISFTYIVA